MSARRWLLSPRRVPTAGPLADYLSRGLSEFKVQERHLVTQRVKAGRAWYAVEADVEAPIVFTYLNRSGARFVRNLAEGVPLNNWLAIAPHDGVSVDALFSVLSSNEVQERLRDNCRVYGSGMWKLEPGELKQLVLPVAAKELLTCD